MLMVMLMLLVFLPVLCCVVYAFSVSLLIQTGIHSGLGHRVSTCMHKTIISGIFLCFVLYRPTSTVICLVCVNVFAKFLFVCVCMCVCSFVCLFMSVV